MRNEQPPKPRVRQGPKTRPLNWLGTTCSCLFFLVLPFAACLGERQFLAASHYAAGPFPLVQAAAEGTDPSLVSLCSFASLVIVSHTHAPATGSLPAAQAQSSECREISLTRQGSLR